MCAEGRTLWKGVVEVFELAKHPDAKFAYAWSYRKDDGERVAVVVLGIPPINSARDAVRAAVVAEMKRAMPAD